MGGAVVEKRQWISGSSRLGWGGKAEKEWKFGILAEVPRVERNRWWGNGEARSSMKAPSM